MNIIDLLKQEASILTRDTNAVFTLDCSRTISEAIYSSFINMGTLVPYMLQGTVKEPSHQEEARYQIPGLGRIILKISNRTGYELALYNP